MTRVVVPVDLPVTATGTQALEQALDIATDAEDTLVVLHVEKPHRDGTVSRRRLKRRVESAVDPSVPTRYVVESSLFVDESVLDALTAHDADVVVLGDERIDRWRSMIRRLADDPAIEAYLDEQLDCQILRPTASD